MTKISKIMMAAGIMMSYFALLIAEQPYDNGGYLPILVDGRLWTYGDSMAGHSKYPIIHQWSYCKIEKDSIFDGRIWKKIIGWSSIIPESLTFTSYNHEGDGVIYFSGKDENGKRYFSEDFKYIDMNLKVGDDFGIGEVIKVDSINVRGVVRKRISMNSCRPTEQEAFFVEGIGASSDAYIDLGPGDHSETGYIRYLLSVTDENGNVIFTQEDFRAPSYSESGIVGVEDDAQNDDRIYDLYGQPVSNPLPGSIYICRGKKFIQPRK